MTDTAHQRLCEIQAERLASYRETVQIFARPDPRFAVIQLARGMDAAQFLDWSLDQTLGASPGVSPYAEGWDLAAGPFLSAVRAYWDQIGTPLLVSDHKQEDWSAYFLAFCNSLRTGEHAIDLTRGPEDGVARGDGTAELPLDTASLRVHMGYRDDIREMRQHLRQSQRSEIEALGRQRGRVLSSMRSRCMPWREAFPSYSTTPLIEKWYARLGRLVATRMLELFLLPRDLRFASVRVETFIDIIIDEISIALRHLDYCAILHEKHPDLRWHNLLTITRDCDTTIDELAARYQLTVEAMRTVVEALSWHDDPGTPRAIDPLPLFIRTSSNQHVRLLTGVLGEPGRFLVRTLRLRFPTEWQHSEPARVDALRRVLRKLLHRASFIDGVIMLDDLEIRASVDDPLAVTVSAPRRLIYVSGDDRGITMRPRRVDDTTVLCGFAWFARTIVEIGPRLVTGERLWQDAVGERDQLRVERIPAVFNIPADVGRIGIWSRSIFPESPPSSSAADAIEVFDAAVKREEAALAHACRTIDFRYPLSLVLSAVDAIASPEFALPNESPPAEDTVDESRTPAPFLTFVFGCSRALAIFAGTQTEGSWPPTQPPPVSSRDWGSLVVARAGEIVYLDQVSALVRTGLADVEPTGPMAWVVTVKTQGETIESRERAHIRELTARIRRMGRDVLNHLESAEPKILRQLARRVHISRKADERRPDTLELRLNLSSSMHRYFVDGARYAVSRMLAADSFDDEATFGGVAFGVYRLAAAVLTAEAMARVFAAEALRTQDALFDPRSVKTTGWRIPILAGRVADALGVSDDDAARVIDGFTLDADFAPAYKQTPRAALPPLVRTAADHVWMSGVGCLDEPFQFLLLKLRHRFASDWDRAIDGREAIFRRQLYTALTSGHPDRFVTSSAGIRLRDDQRLLTDIDAVMFDRLTGDLALVQLKWQEPFGSSLAKRASVAKNFTTGSKEWVELVSTWLASRTTPELRNHFHLPDDGVEPRPHLFVLGRYAAHFTGYEPDARAAWGTWPQVMNLMATTNESPEIGADAVRAPLAWLDESLRQKSPHAQALRADSGEQEIQVGGLHVSVRYG